MFGGNMKNTTMVMLIIFVTSVALIGCSGKNKEKTNITNRPYAQWSMTESLEGSRSMTEAVIVPAFNRWYIGQSSGGFQWFALDTEPGTTYNVYLDDASEGSGSYSGDVVVWIFRKDGSTKYDSKDNGYSEPITIKADDSKFYLAITTLIKGPFAFGIEK
jgi:hypothetical protein